jgi:hypothetical protein
VSFTFDVSTDLGKCRLLITDTDSTRPLMDDDDVQAFITMSGHYMPGAAMALDALAANMLLSQGVVNIMGMTVDSAAAAKMLMVRAEKLRSDYALYSASNGPGFATAEMPDGAFSWEEKILKEYLRGHL